MPERGFDKALWYCLVIVFILLVSGSYGITNSYLSEHSSVYFENTEEWMESSQDLTSITQKTEELPVCLKHRESTLRYQKYQKAMLNLAEGMRSAYDRYTDNDAAWYAFPERVYAWADLVTKQMRFKWINKAYESFKLQHEAISATSITDVETVFQSFETLDGAYDPYAETTLIHSNDDAWQVRWELLNQARHSIEISYFTIDQDTFGEALMGALLQKAEEGVAIRILVDAAGSSSVLFMDGILQDPAMEKLSEYPHVDVLIFNPASSRFTNTPFDLRRALASYHSKILVVDEKYAVVGGRNIANYHLQELEKYPYSLDVDVFIESPIVAQQLTAVLDEEIYFGYVAEPKEFSSYNKTSVKDSFNEMKHILHQQSSYSPSSKTHTGAVKIINKNSALGPRRDLVDEIIRYIDASQDEIIMENAYFVPTKRVLAALQRAADRGVDIIIHTNSPRSSTGAALFIQAMFYEDWRIILQDVPTSTIYVRETETGVHGKAFVFDGQISVVGSYNLDYLSEKMHADVAAIVDSTCFAEELRSHILHGMEESTKYQIKENAEGTVVELFGPDDVPSPQMWLIKLLSHFRFLLDLV